MKKVAVLLTSEPISGGEHQYLTMVMEALKRYDGRYFEVLAICCNRYWTRWCRDNLVRHINYKLRYYTARQMFISARFAPVLKYYSTFFTELGRIITANRIELIICGQQSVYIPRYLCKSVRLVHDIMHRYERGFMELRADYDFREALFKAGAMVADVVLVDSQLGKKQFMDCYYGKSSHPKVIVLPFAVADSMKDAVETAADVPGKYLFYPAQFWEHKNHKNLIRAVELAKHRIPDIHLVLVGSERNSATAVRRQIRSSGLDENVSVLGFVSNGQMKYLYKHAVALVMPTYFGPTNIPPLEAMMFGCPVIVSDKYAMGEQVGDAGLMCDPDVPEDIAECICSVWTDNVLRDRMIEKGYRKSAQWTSDDFKDRFIKIVLKELELGRV